MKFTELTKQSLAYRRQRKEMVSKGYEEITMAFGIGNLWELDRGGRYDFRLVDAVLGTNGKSVFVKAEPRT